MSTPRGSDSTPVRVHHIREAKERGERVTMLTAYDFPTARIFDAAGIDMLLIGDSIGDNILGHPSTLPVTLDEMIPHVRAVSRGVQRALVVADLPFGSYEASPEQALASAVRMVKEGGANAVKFEGGERVTAQVRAITGAGIPVMGHLGFTPQSENILGGKRVQGRGPGGEERLTKDAVALQEAGAFAVVLELMPAAVAAHITEVLSISTIGIGAGAGCDGQVLVWLDMAGMGDWSPRFAKQYAHLGSDLEAAAKEYAAEVKSGAFPSPEQSYLQ